MPVDKIPPISDAGNSHEPGDRALAPVEQRLRSIIDAYPMPLDAHAQGYIHQLASEIASRITLQETPLAELTLSRVLDEARRNVRQRVSVKAKAPKIRLRAEDYKLKRNVTEEEPAQIAIGTKDIEDALKALCPLWPIC